MGRREVFDDNCLQRGSALLGDKNMKLGFREITLIGFVGLLVLLAIFVLKVNLSRGPQPIPTGGRPPPRTVLVEKTGDPTGKSTAGGDGKSSPQP